MLLGHMFFWFAYELTVNPTESLDGHLSIHEDSAGCLSTSSGCLQKLIESGVGGNNHTSYLGCDQHVTPPEKIFGKKKRQEWAFGEGVHVGEEHWGSVYPVWMWTLDDSSPLGGQRQRACWLHSISPGKGVPCLRSKKGVVNCCASQRSQKRA